MENAIVDAAAVTVERCFQAAVTETDSAVAVDKPSVAEGPSSSSAAEDTAVAVVSVADKASAAALLSCC